MAYRLFLGSGQVGRCRQECVRAPPGCLHMPARLWKSCKENIYFLTRWFPCGEQAWLRKHLVPPRRGPCVAHLLAELSLSKCPAWAERYSMLHGFPLFLISLNFFPQMNKVGRLVLTTCKSAQAWPCTIWHHPGPCKASKYSIWPGLFPISMQLTKTKMI